MAAMDRINGLGPLPDGGRVVIVGGGPGGTACALALHRLAAAAGRRIEITLLEAKRFTGEQQHNLSVGVLSPPLPQLMAEYLGIDFPRQLGKAEIAGYVLHGGHDTVRLEDHGEHGVAVRRVEWDDFMLETARARGIHVVHARAVDVDFNADGVVVYTDRAPLAADVVVGAYGLDEGSEAFFGRATAYRPPPALVSVLTKYHPGPAGMAEIGSWVHAFLPGYGGIEFGAITPKGDHITINIAGARVGADTLQYFLAQPEVRAALPCFDTAGLPEVTHSRNPDDLRFFKGRFPNSQAYGYYGDRYVIVGDAAGLVRAFKGKGITTAVQTGVRAAHTIIEAGISRAAFEADFAAANRDITDDLPYGRAMRVLVALSARFGLLDPVIRAAGHNEKARAGLFDAVSAHAPYRDVLIEMLHPSAVGAVLREMVRGSAMRQE
jgi:flavin-dependent dehydrogenase